jgi:acyl-CoA hydrolase
MEVGVKVWVENYMTATNRHVASAYLTFVAVDQHGNRLPVPPVIAETDEEKHRYDDAQRRRENRKAELAHKAKKQS